MIRDIIASILIFVLGIGAASAYFYHIHPEHHFSDDIPLFRKDYEEAVENSQSVTRQWRGAGEKK